MVIHWLVLVDVRIHSSRKFTTSDCWIIWIMKGIIDLLLRNMFYSLGGSCVRSLVAEWVSWVSRIWVLNTQITYYTLFLADPDCTRITCHQCKYVFCRHCLQGFHIGDCDPVETPEVGPSGNCDELNCDNRNTGDDASRTTIKVGVFPTTIVQTRCYINFLGYNKTLPEL